MPLISINLKKSANTRNLIIGLAMFLAALSGLLLKPTMHVADNGPKFNLKDIIPSHFGTWQTANDQSYQMIDPEVKAKQDKIYSQILTRNYINSQGYQVMLTITYGADQSDDFGAHDPQVCYPANGFQITNSRKTILRTKYGDVPVRRIGAINGSRHEPVTYWFTVGKYVVDDGLDRKLAQLRYAMKGEIPDGILFRVSSIDKDESIAFRAQQNFVNDLLQSLDSQGRKRLIGDR
jgi:EpsI family protein